ncbi:uncharacterized protein Z520_11749 [Fonsecaea multimorphosa CBS 102226]|uniref:Uncharacterized protein n=1 Tax=Fonsecaea multimorphosa CBS 102226 TaxID=1442371 RepID=A0A0D2K8C1_9EURO|nr:uncharacterized protein Z520_11749 [Fonsecaea multimorphosa CBS 102226]KIX92573.1 hypothetical protein Z520_11749 [Fonsecaea multimorphosa CBS 102226]
MELRKVCQAIQLRAEDLVPAAEQTGVWRTPVNQVPNISAIKRVYFVFKEKRKHSIRRHSPEVLFFSEDTLTVQEDQFILIIWLENP